MPTATDLIVQYARYHRDPRNIATHFIGIPLIVFAVAALLALLPLLGNAAAWLAWTAFTVWALRRAERTLALATSAIVALLVALAARMAHMPGTAGAWIAIGSFMIGWMWQLAGHAWEGRKPAFVDDLRGLLVGPMFVVAEAGFAFGAWRKLHAAIVSQAGPVARRTTSVARRAG